MPCIEGCSPDLTPYIITGLVFCLLVAWLVSRLTRRSDKSLDYAPDMAKQMKRDDVFTGDDIEQIHARIKKFRPSDITEFVYNQSPTKPNTYESMK